MRRLLAIFMLLLVLAGCGGEKTIIPEYDLDESVTSLDPQFAEGAEQTAVANLFLGLVRQAHDGSVLPACAESWQVSADGLRYTFTLRDDLVWADGTAMTSDDFLFAFERIFSSAGPSPYADDYANIKNAAEVLAGTLPTSSLGVSAPDAHTLVITLSRAQSDFLVTLTQCAAMPCNREFFARQKGRYALSTDTLLTNGAFSVSSWKSDVLQLIRSDNAAVTAAIDGVNLNLNVSAEDAAARYLAGTTTACLFTDEQAENEDLTGDRIYDRTWSLLINPSAADALNDSAVRAAILSAADTDAVVSRLPASSAEPQGLIAPAFKLGSVVYRDAVGEADLPSLPQNPRTVLREAEERLGLDELPSLTLLVSDDGVGADIGGAMQRGWSDTLSLYVNMESVAYDALQSRIVSGSFDLAIAPLSASAVDTTGGLAALAALLGDNGADISVQLASVQSAADASSAAGTLLAAENALLSQYIALPLCSTPSLFAVRDGYTGIWCDATQQITYFIDAAAN